MTPERALELLARERERVEHALVSVTAPTGNDELSNLDQHLADAGSELYQRESDAGLAIQLQGELEAIERAEARLAAGTYGLSLDSGEPIPDARLELVPWAERTTEEQARFEHGR